MRNQDFQREQITSIYAGTEIDSEQAKWEIAKIFY